MSSVKYQKAYDRMTEIQKQIMADLYMKGINHDYIINLDNQLQFIWDKDGTPHITTEDEEEAFKKLLERKEIPAKCADVELLETLLSAVLTSYKHNYGDEITVYYPNFVKALGTRTGGKEEHRADVKQKLRELENTAGVLVEQKKIQRAFALLEVDEKENTMTFKSPYLYSICDFLKKNPSKVSKVIKNDRGHSWNTYGDIEDAVADFLENACEREREEE